MKNIFLIVFFLFFSQVHAQNTISGLVKDIDEKPIEYANVILIDLETGKIKTGTITNKDGEFLIELAEKCNCKLTISFIGFQKWFRNIKVDESFDLGVITLTKSLNKLDEVTVVADVNIFERKEDKIVFNIQNSLLKTGYTGMEVLEQSPSVWIENESILIRNETARVLINGKKINLSGNALSNYLSNIDSKNIKSIEVQTNKDASTDAESTGGVINIILIKKLLGYNGSVGSFYLFKGEDYFTNLNTVNFNYGTEKWNIYSSYGYFKNTGYTTNITDISYLETQNFLKTEGISDFDGNLHRYTAGFVVQLHKNHEFGIEIYGNINTRKSNEKGNFSLTNNSNIIDGGAVSTDDDISINIFNAVANYSWNMGNNSSLKVYVDYLKNKRLNTNNFLSTYSFNVFEGITERNNADSKAEVIAFQTDFKKIFKSKLKLDIGAKYTATDRLNNFLAEFLDNDIYIMNDDRTTSFNYKENIVAAYISTGKKFKEKNYFKIGLRVENTNVKRKNLLDNDKIRQDYTNLFPSLFYSRDFENNKSVSASYSRSLRRPSFGLLSNDVVKVNDFRYELGNPDLQPEYIDKYELSYLFKKQSVSLYYNKTNEAINGIYFLEGDIAFYKKINSGAQVQYGIDYNRSDKIYKWWSIRFFGNLYNRKFVDSQGVDSFEKVTTSLRIFNNFKINKTTTINLSGYYISPKTDAFYEANEKYRINLGLRKSFFNKKFNVRIDLNDIFNTLEYKDIREFDNFATTHYSKSITRTLRFWLTYNFSNEVKISKKKNKSKNEIKNRL